MDLTQSFGFDTDLAENGKWFDLELGGRAKVAKLGCIAFKREIKRLSKPHLALLQSSMDTSELLDSITRAAMSRTILLDWEAISIDGKIVPYSHENAEMAMTRFPDFQEVISAISVERTNYPIEEVAGKLPTPSSGGESTETITSGTAR